VDYFTTKTPLQHLQTGAQPEFDRRRTKRHLLRARALVGIPGQSPIRGQVLEVSEGGVCVVLPIATNIGIECTLFFTVMLDGKTIALSGPGKVMSCVYANSDGFRVGMTFRPQDPKAQEALNKLLGVAVAPENFGGRRSPRQLVHNRRARHSPIVKAARI